MKNISFPIASAVEKQDAATQEIARTVDGASARITNLSSGGAMIVGALASSAGARGSLGAAGFVKPVPFIVKAHKHGRLHVKFELSAAEEAAMDTRVAALTRGLRPLRDAA